jgi:hypothetical protein
MPKLIWDDHLCVGVGPHITCPSVDFDSLFVTKQ